MMRRAWKAVFVISVIVVLAGCSPGLQVLQKPAKGEKLAILMFSDCTRDTDCPGSGKKVSDFYSEVLGAPVLMFVQDAKDYDLVLTGNVVRYNEAVPMAFNANIVSVDLKVNRLKDNNTLSTQKQIATGSNIFSSTKGLSKDLANDLKKAMEM